MGSFQRDDIEGLERRVQELEKRVDSLGSSVPPGSESALRSSSSDKPPFASRSGSEIPERGDGKRCSVEACDRWPQFSFCGIWICNYHRERIEIHGIYADDTKPSAVEVENYNA